MTFTVLTPTYNRKDKLHRVYDSLVGQSFRDFEWLVVDDGSTDGTEELVSHWASGADFPIRYVYKENGGKHTALNRGLPEARGRYTIILDSDDACLITSLEEFKAAWESLPNPDRFACVTSLCQDEAGRIVGTEFPAPVWDSYYLEATYVHKMKGDKWECWRTAALREFPFPEPENTRLVPESVVLFAVARRYQTRYLNRPLRIYHDDGADSSLVRVSDPRRHASGSRLCERAALNENLDYFSRAPLYFLSSAAKYVRACWYLRIGFFRQLRELKGGARLLWLLGLAPGLLVVLLERSWKTNLSGKFHIAT